MALQDLTPQLRTRLSRAERAVGWFVALAALVLLVGFAWYVKVMAERKGWFLRKIAYQTSVDSAAGLKVGDPVKLMGFDVGEITRIEANKPYDFYNVTVFFRIKEPYYGYLWSDSVVRVAAADLLGNRYLEVVKGQLGVPTIYARDGEPAGMLRRSEVLELESALMRTNRNLEEVMFQANQIARAQPERFYAPLRHDSVYWLDPAETPALTERLERVVRAVELELTNSIVPLFTNAQDAVRALHELATALQPVATNLQFITTHLREPQGALGEWLLPGDVRQQLTGTLATARTTLDSATVTLDTATVTLDRAQTNLDVLTSNLLVSLEHLAGITSNFNQQVQGNTNLVGSVVSAVQQADQFVQGLRRHWLLRSAFRESTRTRESPRPDASPARLRSPRDSGP